MKLSCEHQHAQRKEKGYLKNILYPGKDLALLNCFKSVLKVSKRNEILQCTTVESKQGLGQDGWQAQQSYGNATYKLRLIIVNRARWFGNSLELQYKSLSMFLFWFMQE